MWRCSFLDFVNLFTAMPSRHSGDQAHEVGFFPHCTKRGGKVKGAYFQIDVEPVEPQVDDVFGGAAAKCRCVVLGVDGVQRR